MHIPKEIIGKAIAGGWKDTFLKQMSVTSWQVAVLDPTFWQALGKALGWSTEWKHLTPFGYKYLDVAHEFLNHVLQGKPTDEFWQELLKDNN